MVDALHIDVPAVDLVRKRVLQNVLDLRVPDRTAFHRQQIILFIHAAPVDHLVQLDFQQMIQPDAGAAPVALTEGVGNVHLHIFLDDLIERGLRHLFNIGEGRFQVHHRSETEIALGDVDGAELTGKIVDLLKEALMDKLQRGKSARRQLIQQALLKKRDCLLFADPLFLTGKVGRGCESQFILERHASTSFA